MKEKSHVGDIINFRGMVYCPINENGVVFLFGRIVEDLNMYIEEVKAGFPDCIARRYVGSGKWEKCYIEFEFLSHNFIDHNHDPRGCDIIVCWEDNQEKFSEEERKKVGGIEIIELKEVIKELENRPITRPDKEENLDKEEREKSLDELLSWVEQDTKTWFKECDEYLRSISEDVWSKKARKSDFVSYYCPERIFVYVRLTKSTLTFYIFTVKHIENLRYSKPEDKWGTMIIKEKKDLDFILPLCKDSYKNIKDLIKSKKSTTNIETEESLET